MIYEFRSVFLGKFVEKLIQKIPSSESTPDGIRFFDNQLDLYLDFENLIF